MSKEKRSEADVTILPGGENHPAEHPAICSRPVSLPFGFAAAVTANGLLHAVEWEISRERLQSVLSSKYPGSIERQRGRGDISGTLLRSYADGKVVRWEEIRAIPFAWHRVRPFSRRVLMELAKVPYGTSLSYGELAVRCGRPGAARAVGSVLSRNLWPILLPCHRVIGAGGEMVGFGKGTGAKERLIRFEKERVDGGSIA